MTEQSQPEPADAAETVEGEVDDEGAVSHIVRERMRTGRRDDGARLALVIEGGGMRAASYGEILSTSPIAPTRQHRGSYDDDLALEASRHECSQVGA